MSSPSSIITTETSSRICKHMNEDHGASVYAMAKQMLHLKSGWKLTDARMREINAEGCRLQAVTCSGDLCEMQKLDYKFDPPLQSAQEARPRLVAIHRQACAPSVLKLMTQPLALMILIACTGLLYGAIIGEEQIIAKLQKVGHIVPESVFFGSFANFAKATIFFFWFTIVAHGLEAIYGIYHAKITLKLPISTTLHWGLWIFLLGFVAMSDLQALVTANNKHKKTA